MSMCKKMLTFSYDDGIYQDERLVEIFNKYGMKATFNLNTGIQSPESNFEIEGIKIARMEQEGLAKLYEGHEIALHGLTHASPSGIKPEDYSQEYLQDARNIEKLYGKYPVGMAYAYGDVPDPVVSYLKDIGIRYGRITLTGGIPFSLSLPKAPAALNADTMTDDQLHAALQVGIKEIQNGDTVDAASAFAQFREQHR